MRIRKHAKISPLAYALSSGIVLQPYICQLNQSPWDVIDFSPLPSTQVNESVASAVNGWLVPTPWSELKLSEFPVTIPPPPPEKDCKTDGKRWREDDDHLLLAKSNSSHCVTKKPAGEAEASRRPRRKKAPSSAPDDFYYYSGFGPRWGKKRGESSRNNQHEEEIRVKKNGNEIEESDNVEYEEKEKKVGKKRGRKPIKARSLKSLM